MIISNPQSGLNVVTPGAGYAVLPCMYPYNDFGGGRSASLVANTTYAMMLTIPYSFSWHNVLAYVLTPDAGALFSVGLYDLSGNLLVSSGAMSGAIAGNVLSTVTPYQVQPGTYYYGWTTNDSSLGLSMDYGLDGSYASLINAFSGVNGLNAFQSSVASSGGVLPAQLLGTKSAATFGSNGVGPPVVFFYV